MNDFAGGVVSAGVDVGVDEVLEFGRQVTSNQIHGAYLED